jgi:hypothetical protein
MSATDNNSQDVLCPEEAMSGARLTATTNLPSTKTEEMYGSAEDTACIYHIDEKGR